jgi:hypothetical protein
MDGMKCVCHDRFTPPVVLPIVFCLGLAIWLVLRGHLG